ARDVLGRDAAAVLGVMRALGEDEQVIAPAALLEPESESTLALAAGVDVRGIDDVAAQLQPGVEQLEGVLQRLAREDHAAEDQAGEVPAKGGEGEIFHHTVLFALGARASSCRWLWLSGRLPDNRDEAGGDDIGVASEK